MTDVNEKNNPIKDLVSSIIEPSLKRIVEQSETRILDKLSNFETQSPKDDLITPDEVCKRLQISRTTLWNYENKGYLNSKGIGARRYYNWNEVVEALQSKKL